MVAVHLGRTVRAVRSQRSRLIAAGQLPKRPSRWDAPGTGPGTPFSAAELAQIADPALTVSEVAQRTRRSPKTIAWQRLHRGITPPAWHRWTAAEEQTLIAMQDRPLADVAAVLGRPTQTIQKHRAALVRAGQLPPKERHRSS